MLNNKLNDSNNSGIKTDLMNSCVLASMSSLLIVCPPRTDVWFHFYLLPLLLAVLVAITAVATPAGAECGTIVRIEMYNIYSKIAVKHEFLMLEKINIFTILKNA